MLVVGFVIMHLPGLVESLSLSKTYPTETKVNLFEFNLTGLPEGDYILTVGKARAICSISLDGKVLKTSHAPDGVMPEISIDHPVRIENGNSKLDIDCTKELKGFPTRLMHSPVLVSYQAGKFLSLARYGVDVLLGSFAAGFLLLMVAYLSVSSGHWIAPLLLLAFTAGFYSLNQSYLLRTLFSGEFNTWLHPTSKSLFTWMLYRVMSEKKRYDSLDAVFLILPITLFTYFYNSQESIKHVYKFAHMAWFALFIFVYLNLFKSRGSALSKSLTLVWAIALLVDSSSVFSAFGQFFSPVFFGVLVCGLAFQAGTISRKRSEQFECSKELIAIATKSDQAPIDSINTFANALMIKTGFTSYSIYLDGTLIGTSDRSSQRYERVAAGGKINSLAPSSLVINDGDGKFIAKAISSSTVLTMKGESKDGWFSVVPIGNRGAICLATSNKDATPDLVFFDSILDLSAPALNAADSKLRELSRGLNSSLARLRGRIDNGSYELVSGAIFIDIADYSKHCESYGTAYAEFISSSFFPAMIKYLDGLATPESVRGDEVYFVIARELSTTELSIGALTSKALVKLYSFLNEEGLRLAHDNGFDAVEYRLGVTMGEGNLVIDDVQVRTSGEHINRAKRMQDSASKGEILADIALVENSEGQIFSITKKSIIVKKNQIEAARVGIKRAA